VFPPPLDDFAHCIFSSRVTQYMQVKALLGHLGELHSSSSVDALSGAGSDTRAAAAEAKSMTSTFSALALFSSCNVVPGQFPCTSLVQRSIPAPSGSSDSDMPVSPVRHSAARSTPIAIEAPKVGSVPFWLRCQQFILTSPSSLHQVSTGFLFGRRYFGDRHVSGLFLRPGQGSVS